MVLHSSFTLIIDLLDFLMQTPSKNHQHGYNNGCYVFNISPQAIIPTEIQTKHKKDLDWFKR